MQDLALTVTYFAEPGPQNTDTTLTIALDHARTRGIDTIVVASDTGKTARAVLERSEAHKIVVVTNPANLRFPVAKLHDYLPRFQQHKQSLLDQGTKVIPCSLSSEVFDELQSAGAAVTRIDWKRLQAFTRSGLGSIDRVGVGMRVGLTIVAWAQVAGVVEADREVIALAGTGFGGGGADTAIVVRTAARFPDFRVLLTLARPRVSPPSEMA